MPLMAGPNTAHPRHEACRETESREPEGKPQKCVQKCLVSILNISSDVRLVRFPNPLAFGSGLGERTPKKAIFQLRRPVV